MDEAEATSTITDDVKDEQAVFIEMENGTKTADATDGAEPPSSAHRHRLWHTVCICSTMLGIGWRVGLIGPTFPDLRRLLGQDLSTASWILTGMSLGEFLGAFCGGIAYDRLPKIPLFVFTTLAIAVVTAIVPWCNSFALVLFVFVLMGAFGTVVDIGATADIARIWGNDADSYMQVVHSMFCIGAITSAFVTKPFLAERISHRAEALGKMVIPGNVTHFNATGDMGPLESSHDTRTSIRAEFAKDFHQVDSFKQLNYTNTNGVDGAIGSYFEEMINTTDSSIENLNLTTNTYYGDTNIHVAYAISSGVWVLSVVLFIAVNIVYGNIYNTPMGGGRSSKQNFHGRKGRKGSFLSNRMKGLLTSLLALQLSVYLMGERGMSQFLMTFMVSKLNWPQSRGATATATYFIAVAIGRLSSAFVVRLLKITKVIIVYLLLALIGCALFWISVIFNINALLWISIALIGFGIAPIFGGVFIWLSIYVRTLTGTTTSIFFLFNSSGGMVSPIVLGYLMDKVSQMWLLYFEGLIFAIVLSLFICIVLVYKALLKRANQENNSKSGALTLTNRSH